MEKIIKKLQVYRLIELERALRMKQESAINDILKFIQDNKSSMLLEIEEGKRGFWLLEDVEVVAGGTDEEKVIWSISGVVIEDNSIRFLAENDSGDRFTVGLSGITFGLSELVEAMNDVLGL